MLSFMNSRVQLWKYRVQCLLNAITAMCCDKTLVKILLKDIKCNLH